MADHNVNINIKDTSVGSGVTRTTKPVGVQTDPSRVFKKLESSFDKTISNLSKTLEKSLEKAITKSTIKQLPGTVQRKGDVGINTAALKFIAKQLSAELATQIIKGLSKKTIGGASDATTKTLLSGIDKQVKSAVDKINSTLKTKTGVELDVTGTKVLTNSIVGAIEKSIPKSLGQATRDLSKAVSSIQSVAKEISYLVSSIGKMRKSEGGIDIKEIKPVVDSLKKLTTEFKKLPEEMKQARESAKLVVKEEKQIYADFSAALTDLKRSMKQKVEGVKQRAVEDPQKFAKVIAGELSKAVKSMPALKGTKIESVLSDLDKKIGSVSEAAKAFKGVEKELKAQIKGGRVSVGGIDALLKAIDTLNTNLGNLPKTIDTPEGTAFKGIEAFTKRTERFLRTLEKFKLEINLGETKHLEETLEKSAEAAVKKGIVKATEKVKPEIKVDVKIDKKDVLASTKDVLKDLESKTKTLFLQPTKTIVSALESHKIHKYPEGVIQPAEKVRFKSGKDIPSGTKVKQAIESNVESLAKSLKQLQEYMVDTLSSEFAKSSSGWDIVRESSEQAVSEYFKIATGKGMGNIKTAGKQWVLKIADVKKMQEELGKGYEGLSSVELVKAVKKKRVKGMVEEVPSRTLPFSIASWMKDVTKEIIEGTVGVTDAQKKSLIKIKDSFKGAELTDVAKEVERALGSDKEIKRVFSKTYASLAVDRQMTKRTVDEFGKTAEPIIKSLAIPAAKLTSAGTTTFETATGSQRALPKFAVFKTGFERLYETLLQAKKLPLGETYAERIRGVGVKPIGVGLEDAEKLAKEMLKVVTTIPEKKNVVVEQYRRAATMRGLELEKAGVGSIDEFEDKIESVIVTLDKLPQAEQSIDGFIESMDKAGLSAYDVVRSLDALRFENVYDILKRATGTPLKGVAKEPYFDRSVRRFEGTTKDFEQLLPIIEPGRPRRGPHLESVTQLLTRMSPVYKDTGVQLSEQKDLIKDINVRLGEMVSEAKALQREGGTGAAKRLTELNIPTTIRELSTLGVPESLAGKIEPMAEKGRYLKDINALTMKMYSENLRELAPFGSQFQAWQRNIANVTNAMSSASKETEGAFKKFGEVVGGTGTEIPTLRTERERELISGGSYGKRGYGFNVLAELRTTAGTFEDQVLISGKIAEALTSITKTLVQPTVAGRLEKGDVAAGTTEIEKKLLKGINQASIEIHKVLGMPEEYKGRADKALIEDVTKAVSVVRGADVEVQAAKIAEVFLNYFGRKITTRYGSKGVGITPQTMREVIQYHGEKQIKVLPKAERTRAGLGVAVMPKSMGQLASEIITKEAEKLEKKGMASTEIKKLSTGLVTSGNKFMLDMFKKSGVIAEDEIKVQKDVFTKLRNALKQLDINLASDIEGIGQLKRVYKERVGEPLYEEKPIDIRISAAGLAKRGLQTEVLEAVMGNIVGAGPGGVTTMKTELKPEQYRKMLGEPGKPGMLSQYSEALGFEAALPGELGTQERKRAYSQLVEKFKKKFGEGKEDIAERAAELEALSSFYVEVIDELNKGRKGLVGPKFAQIIEEPHMYPEWETKAIEKGIKGEKLDLPAFAAYAGIFGEQSAFMEEIKKASTIDTKEAWEYIKALQTVSSQDTEFKKQLMTPLKTVDLMDIKGFEDATGTMEELRGTVLDLQKFPSPFKVKIPTSTKEAKEAYEELYIPGALGRGTYDEPLIAGEKAPKGITRRLAILISAAKKVESGRTEIALIEQQVDTLKQQLELTEDQGLISSINEKLVELNKGLERFYAVPENVEAVKQSITKTVGGLVASANKLAKTRTGEEELLEIINKLMGAVSETAAPAGGFITTGVSTTLPEKTHIEELMKKQLAEKSPFEAYRVVANRLSDMLIGVSASSKEYLKKMKKDLYNLEKVQFKGPLAEEKSKEYGGTPENIERRLKSFVKVYESRLKAVPGVEKAAKAGDLTSLAKKVGATIKPSEAKHEKAIASLARAKIDYYNALAEEVLGKKGAVAEVLFSRKIPAVMGKAVSATVDKTEELKVFSDRLRCIYKSFEGLDDKFKLGELEDVAEGILQVREEHAKNVEQYKKIGLPVLKQYELGVPARYAKKIPVKYKPKYRIKKTGIERIPEERQKEISGTLFDILKESEGLLKGGIKKRPSQPGREELRKYVEKELVPYIESVRYPFTGVSSVQPYRARLMKGKKAEHTLAVPGMPEMDLEVFDDLINKVKGIRDKLEKERGELKDIPEDIEKRKRLSKAIDEINSAISAVLPKYIAHQQKLDFDGDAIEIHSAATKEARDDIKKHFDSLSGDIDSTKAVFRDFFTYGARQPATGDYPLAEMSKAFEKRFPMEKGFEFLKKPFLTKELEYIEPAKQLDILAGVPKAKPAADILGDIVRETVKIPEDQKQALEAIEKTTAGGADALVKAIEDIGGDIEKLVKEGLKTRTFEEKYKDALEAQLYKIHTGPETEQLYRLVRMVEMNVGFGAGQAGTSVDVPRATEAFKKRWPKIKALGAEPVVEFQTMINELLRFGIQKGMDVKHAGELPVSGEVVRELSKGENAAEKLFQRIVVDGESAFSELKDFAVANEEAIRRRLGRLPTAELRSEAIQLRAARDMEVFPVKHKMTREQVTKDIVEMVGFKGFLAEVAKQIREEAIEGLIKQTEALPAAKRPKGAEAGVREWATREIAARAKKGRVGIKEFITAQRQPLYMKRIWSAKPQTELEEFESAKGKLKAPEFVGMYKKQQKEYIQKYKEAQATAMNLAENLQSATKDMGGGAYAQMVSSAIENIYNEQEQIQKLLLKVKDFKAPEASLVERVFRETGVKETELAKEVIGDPFQISDESTRRMRAKVEKYSKLTGTPVLEGDVVIKETLGEFRKVAEEMFITEGMDPKQFEERVEKFAHAWVAKAEALAQVDRIIEVLATKRYEGQLLRNILPSPEDLKKISGQAIQPFVAEQQAPMSRVERESLVERFRPRTQKGLKEDRGLPAEKSAIEKYILPKGVKDCIPITNCGKPLNVYIVGADDAVRFDVGQGRSLTSALKQQTKESGSTILEKQLTALRNLAEEATGKLNKLSGTTYETMYRASGLGAGGKYEQMKHIFKPSGIDPSMLKQSQTQKIMEQMLGLGKVTPKLEASALLGTAIHTKVEKGLEKKHGERVETERFVKYEDEMIGTIAGHIDAVFKDAAGNIEKVMDIKTVGENLINDLKKGKAGQYTRQKLEEVASQLNFYIAALAKETGQQAEDIVGEVQFYSRLAPEEGPTIVQTKFDPERLKRDLESVKKSRELIQKYIVGKGPLEDVDVKYRKIVENVKKQLKGKEIQFAPAASLEELEKLDETLNVMTDARIDAFVKLATSYYKKLESGVLPSKRAPIGPSPREDALEKRERIRQEQDFKDIMDLDLDFGTFEEAHKPKAGLEGIFESLVVLHEQAKAYQNIYDDIDFDAVFKTLDKDVQGILDAAQEMGKASGAGPSLVSLLEQLQDQGVIGRAQSSKIWKMYRMAIGDFFIKEAVSAKKAMADAGDDFAAANQAYAGFKANIEKFQKYITESLGKQTDIYTFQAGYGREFWTPKTAMAAGVYQQPREIARKAGGPIGEDENLRKLYKMMTEDVIEGGPMKAPIFKAREVVEGLTGVNDKLLELADNTDLVERKAKEASEAWDFKGLVGDVTRLRAALQKYIKLSLSGDDFTVEQKRNLQDTLSYLTQVERMYSKLGKADLKPTWGETGAVKVPTWLDPKTQRAIHSRNIGMLKEYFKRTEEAGGPKAGERFTYMMKILDQTGGVVKNTAYDFHKYGEYVNKAGEATGAFSEKQRDLMEYTQGANRSFAASIRRVAMWGGAATVVYGGISQLKGMVGTLSDIETGMAQLRMVMSPLETNFGNMEKSAVKFAKQYGVPMTDVLSGMKVFAQQGLKQEDVVDRTRTATLASNVTTLGAKDATEALTAAMKVFRQEGEGSMRFMDAWSEVEAKHAITSADMADGMKKAASAGKNAGFTFDELNGVIASIGSVTRQTGKEVGTSMRFIFRRLISEKAPKELAKLNIPVLTDTGELRRGYDILSDLAGSWKDLTSAQKMNIAQAIGGTRQYNALLVLMDNWNEAVSATKDSINSKGSAERRNLEVMKTYTKQLQQTKQAAVELQMEFGKVYLPIAKFGLKGLRFLLESLSAIPISVKAAATGLALLVTYIAKGDKLITGLGNSLGKGSQYISDFFGAFKKGTKVSLFEIFGKGTGKEFEGLKKIGEGKSIKDFHSAIGKTAFMVAEAGTAYNKFIGDVVVGSGKAAEAVGEAMEKTGESVTLFNEATMEASGLGIGAVRDILSKQGLKGLLKAAPKVLGSVAAIGVEVAGQSTKYAGKTIDALGEKIGGGGKKFLKEWASQNTGFVKATAPMIASMLALVPILKVVYDYYGKTTKSAQDYEKSVYGIRRANESELSTIRDLIKEYDSLEDRLEDIKEASKPEVKARRMELGTYEAPILSLDALQKDAVDTSNKLAETNINLVAGYDKLGNAVLKTVGNFKEYLGVIEKLKVKEMAKTEVNVLEKYVKDLTEIEGPEKWKFELKKLLKEAPVFGEIIGKHIKISPAKALDEVTKKLNALIALKNKFPISTAFDKDIKKYQGSLKDVRKGFTTTYKDFRRVLSDVPTAGLSKGEIAKLFSREELRKGYEVMLEVEPRFKLVPSKEFEIPDWTLFDMTRKMKVKTGVKWQDILGAEVMKKAFPKAAPVLDASAILTGAKIETKGIEHRVGKALSGDLITFLDEVIWEYNMAGKQAILSLNKTTDGIVEGVVTYFNTKTFEIEERPFTKEMQQLVENIFPINTLEKDLSERIEVFNEFVAGAAAGLRGLSAKDFKRDFALGERFFSEIPTTTILQGTKGYVPGVGGGRFGESPFQKEWKETTEEFFFKPMREYRKKAGELEKLRLEGLEGGGKATLAKGLYEGLVELQEVLKNNQIVLQYRAVFVDLTKTIEQGTRAMRENLAVGRSRLELEKDVTGYLKGIPEGLENIDLGVQKFSDLTARQKLFIEKPIYRREAVKFKEAEIKGTFAKEQVYAIDKAFVDLESIGKVSKGFGAAMSPEEMKKYVETVVKTGDLGAAELIIETGKVTENTASTVDRLDRILENMGDEEAVEALLSKYTTGFAAGVDGMMGSAERTANAMELVAKTRERYSDNQKVVMASNKALDVLSKNLVQQVGIKKGMDKVEGTFTLFGKRFTAEEFAQRAFGGGMDLKMFVDKMSKEVPELKKEEFDFEKVEFVGPRPVFEESKEIKKLRSLQEADSKTQWVSSKTLIKAGAALTTFEHFNKSHSNDVIKNLEAQEAQLGALVAAGTTEGKDIKEHSDKLEAVKVALVKERETLDFHKMVEAVSAVSTGTMAFAKAIGLTEGQIKLLGAGAISTYAAVKLVSGIMGKELPANAKEFGRVILETTEKGILGGEKPGLVEATKLRNAGEKFVEGFKKQFEGTTGVTQEEFRKYTAVASEADKIRDKAEEGIDTKRLRQVLATYAVSTFAGYAAEKGGEKTNLATLTKKAEKQARIFAEIVEKYPEAADKVIREMYKHVDKMEKIEKKAPVETEERARALETEKARKKIRENLSSIRDEYIKLAEEEAKIEKKAADKIAKGEMARQFKDELNEMERSIEALELGNILRKKLEVETAGLLVGKRRPQPVDFGIRAVTEMAPEEYLRYQGKGVRVEEIGTLEEARSATLGKLEEYTKERKELRGRDLSAAEEKRYFLLGDVIENLTNEIRDYTNRIKNIKEELRPKVIKADIILSERRARRDYEVAAAGREATRRLKPGMGLLAGGPTIPSVELDFGPKTFRELTSYQVARQTAAREGKPTVLTAYEESLEKQSSIMNYIKDTTEKIASLEFEGLSTEADQWRESLQRAQEQLKEVNKTLSDLEAASKKETEASKQLQRVRERMIDALARIESFNLDRFFGNIPTVLNKALRGFSGEAALPPTKREMSSQQLLYATGGKDIKASLTSYNAGIEILKLQANAIAKLSDIRREEIQPILGLIESGTASKSVIDGQVDACKNLNVEQKEIVKAYNAQREALEKQAVAIRNATGFMNTLKNAADALTKLKVSEAVEEMPGVVRAREMAAKMYGGGHPAAKVAISTEQSRMGMMAGVSLQHLQATKYDVKRAELMKRLSQNLDSQSRLGTVTSLLDIPEQRKRDEEAYHQQIQKTKALRQKDMYVQRIHELENYKTTHDLSDKQVKAINNVMYALDFAIGDMLEPASKGEKLKELQEIMDVVTDPRRLKDLEHEYSEISKAGASQVRGVFGEARLDIEEADEKALKMFGADFSDPIISKIDTTNEILTTIADVLGVSKELLSKAFPGTKMFNEPTTGKLQQEIPNGLYGLAEAATKWWKKPMKEKWGLQAGGFISGPGGPREDKVPAMLSPGEYVIRQAAAKNIGYDKLGYMNEKGILPKFADGGEVQKSWWQRTKEYVVGRSERASKKEKEVFQSIEDDIRERHIENRKACERGKDVSSFGLDTILSKNANLYGAYGATRALTGLDIIDDALTYGLHDEAGKFDESLAKELAFTLGGSVLSLTQAKSVFPLTRKVFSKVKKRMKGDELLQRMQAFDVEKPLAGQYDSLRVEYFERQNKYFDDLQNYINTSNVGATKFDIPSIRNEEHLENLKKIVDTVALFKKAVPEVAKDVGVVSLTKKTKGVFGVSMPPRSTKKKGFIGISEDVIESSGASRIKSAGKRGQFGPGVEESPVEYVTAHELSHSIFNRAFELAGLEDPTLTSAFFKKTRWPDFMGGMESIESVFDPKKGKYSKFLHDFSSLHPSSRYGYKNINEKMAEMGASIFSGGIKGKSVSSHTKGELYKFGKSLLTFKDFGSLEGLTSKQLKEVDLYRKKLNSLYKKSRLYKEPEGLALGGIVGYKEGGKVAKEELEKVLSKEDIDQIIKEYSENVLGVEYTPTKRRPEPVAMLKSLIPLELPKRNIAEIAPHTPQWNDLSKKLKSAIDEQGDLHKAWKLLKSGKVTDKKALGSLNSYITKQSEMLTRMSVGEVRYQDVHKEFEKLSVVGSYYSGLQRISFYKDLERKYGKDWYRKFYPYREPTPENLRKAAKEIRESEYAVKIQPVPSGNIEKFHTGGYVGKTGPAILEKGEVILPKSFAAGGMVEPLKFDNKTLNAQQSVSIDFDGLADKMEDAVKDAIEEAEFPKLDVIELPRLEIVELPKLEVDATGVTVPVDVTGATVSVDAAGVAVPVDVTGATVSVDVTGATVPVDVAGATVSVDATGVTVPVDVAGVTVSVDAAGVTVPVDAAGVSIPVDTVGATVSVDTTGVSIPVETVPGANAVGAEAAMSRVEEIAEELNKKILGLSGDIRTMNDEIEIVNDKVVDEQIITVQINNVKDSLYTEMNTLRSVNDETRSSVKSIEVNFGEKLNQQELQLNRALTYVGGS